MWGSGLILNAHRLGFYEARTVIVALYGPSTQLATPGLTMPREPTAWCDQFFATR
jgi:hypothetical protein